jgi:nucleoside-diphosphate-sugar epimerase
VPIAFVTGASGFVGAHLTRRLLAEDFDVHILSRPASNFWRLKEVLGRLHRHEIALSDAEGLAQLMASLKPDHVFHLAAATVVAGTTGGPAELIATNFLGSVNLIAACQEVAIRSLIVTGDSFEYTPSRSALGEGTGCQPESLHGITKLAATLQAQAIAHSQSKPIVVIRLFSTYGSLDNPRRLVPKVIASALTNAPIGLSRPDIARDWIHVDDVVALYLAAAENASNSSGKILNAGTGQRGDLGLIVETVLRLTGSRSEARWGQFAAPVHDDYPWVADMSGTFSALDWRPKIPLEEGLRRTIAAAGTFR